VPLLPAAGGGGGCCLEPPWGQVRAVQVEPLCSRPREGEESVDSVFLEEPNPASPTARTAFGLYSSKASLVSGAVWMGF
jgi:hypothetical protein